MNHYNGFSHNYPPGWALGKKILTLKDAPIKLCVFMNPWVRTGTAMNLFITRFEAIAELVQVNNFLEGLSAPGNMLSGGQAKCHTDDHFFIIRYV